MPWIDRRSPARVLPIALVLALTAYYLAWRVTTTIPPISDPVDWAAGWLFLLIEFGAVSGSVLSYITLTRSRDRTAEVERNAPWLAGLERPPLVDVFICTYNEEREILEDLIVAAAADARGRSERVMQERMAEVTKGLPIPPGMKLF